MYIQFKNVKVKLFSDDSQLFLNFISTKVLSILLFTTSTYQIQLKFKHDRSNPWNTFGNFKCLDNFFFWYKSLVPWLKIA